jgi:hypothetical protein
MMAVIAAIPLTLAAAAPRPTFLLPVDPFFFAEDECLAPATGAAGCPDLSEGENILPMASAALLAPYLHGPAPMLLVELSVLREGTDVTHSS